MICENINGRAKAKEIHSEHPLINQFPIPSGASRLLSVAQFCRSGMHSQTAAYNKFNAMDKGTDVDATTMLARNRFPYSFLHNERRINNDTTPPPRAKSAVMRYCKRV